MRHPFPRNAVVLATCWLSIAGTYRAAEAAPPPLADPTRPPSIALPSGAAARTRVPGTAPDWPQLQSVQVSAPGGAGASALVNGRLVRVGERLGGLTVVAIDGEGILLRAAGFEQRLALVPGVAKTASAGAASVPRTAAAAAAATKEYQ